MSHFTVLVIGDDVEGQLAPYDENTEVERYKEYFDSSSIRRWEDILSREDSDTSVEAGTRLPPLEEGEQYTLEQIASVWNTRFADERVMIDDGGLYQWSTYNPKSKWDWYAIGGRWRGFFKLKDDGDVSEVVEVGEPGVFENEPRYHADVVTKGDIDIEGMRDVAGKIAGERWDNVNGLIAALPIARPWEEFIADATDPTTGEITGDMDEVRRLYGEQPRVAATKDRDVLGLFEGVETFQCSREEYVQRARNAALAPFAYVKDGEWYGKGKMGWFGMSSDEMSEEQWNAQFNSVLDELPDDTVLTLVDCHI